MIFLLAWTGNRWNTSGGWTRTPHPGGQTILGPHAPNRPETCYSEDEPLGEPRERIGGDLAATNQPTSAEAFVVTGQREAYQGSVSLFARQRLRSIERGHSPSHSLARSLPRSLVPPTRLQPLHCCVFYHHPSVRGFVGLAPVTLRR